MASQILERAIGIKDYIVACKRHIHQHPELGMKETETAAFVRAELKKMGVELQPFSSDVGVVGLIRGEKSGSGKVIGLRADMDALPIQEASGLPDTSLVPGVMHACGHDCHTAMLLGAAKLLVECRSQFSGIVKLIFQPAEETLAGSAHMIEMGCLKNPDVDIILGIHGTGDFDTGVIAFLEGSAMASSDSFEVTVHGVAGHGAYPHKSGADPLLAAAHCVTALQGLITRQVNAIHSTVLSICTIHGGVARNAIPSEVTFSGTVRCQDPAVRLAMEERMNKMLSGIVSGYNCSHSLDYTYGVPPLVNDPHITALGRKAASELLGAEHVGQIPYPAMGSEDYSRYVEVVPQSVFARLGIRKPGQATPLFHNGAFVFDENALPIGTGYFVQMVLDLNG